MSHWTCVNILYCERRSCLFLCLSVSWFHQFCTRVKGHFPMLLKNVSPNKTTQWELKGHQNWSAVIRGLSYPYLPFSNRSISEVWSKRDTVSSSIPYSRGWVSLTVPLPPLPVSQAWNKELLSLTQFLLLLSRSLALYKPENWAWNATHIYEIIYCLVFHFHVRKENIFHSLWVKTCEKDKMISVLLLYSDLQGDVNSHRSCFELRPPPPPTIPLEW